MRLVTYFSCIGLTVFFFAAAGCAPTVKLPGVQEPIDSPEWKRCAGELADRESRAMIDDLTLDSKTLLCQGVTLAAAGKVEEGLELLNESGVRDKEDHRPHYMAGRILADAGRYEEALTEFERSARRFPSMEVPTERLGRKLLEEKGSVEARVFLAKADERKLCLYGCQGLLARLHHEAGEDDKAEAIYNKMIKSEPAEPGAYVGLAGIKNSASDYKKEAEFLNKAIDAKNFSELSESERAGIHYSLAFARYNAEDYDRAANSIDAAINLEGNRADWHVLAGWIELKRDRPEFALTRFGKAESLDGKMSAAKIGIGDARTALGEYDKAIAVLEEARDLDPTNAVVILKLAYATAKSGDLEGAKRLVDEAAAIDKDHLPPELLGKITELIGE